MLPSVVEVPSFVTKPEISHWGPQKLMILTMALLVDCALMLMLIFFAAFHVRMVLTNETTIEGYSSEFDVGSRTNWEQVMGSDYRLWFVPLWGKGPAGDGINWPTKLPSQRASDDENQPWLEEGDTSEDEYT